MKTRIALLCWSVAVGVMGQTATTQTTFSSKTDTGIDLYGNQTYRQSVSIQTDSYQVETFWNRFFNPSNTEKEFTDIGTTAQAQLIAEASSGCSIAGKNTLAAGGCSGQKPFLINNEAVPAKNGEKVSLIFQTAYDDKTGNKTFNPTNPNLFYPMDILRNGEYYKEDAAPIPGTQKSFFSFFTGIFDFFFSQTIGFGSDFFGKPKISDTLYSDRSDDAEDRRKRYLSNIIAGIDQEHRVRRPYKGEAGTPLNPQINDPVSLLHYAEAKKATQIDQCKFMFLKMSSDGLMCRMMNGFGMDAWMPFFTSANISKIEVNTITIDTENALLAMTGQVGGGTYQSIGGSDKEKLGFLQQMIKPMVSMMEMMKTMMFGSVKKEYVADPVEVNHELGNKPLTLTMAVTNEGDQIDDFAHFKLLGIRSVMGDEVDKCSVKKSPGVLSWSSWSDTFYIDEGNKSTGTHKNGTIDTHSEWVDWCQKANNKKGMFDYLLAWESGAFFNPFNWMQGMWAAFTTFVFGNYEITDFSSTLKRGLILDLEKTSIDTKDPLTTTKIRLMKVTH